MSNYRTAEVVTKFLSAAGGLAICIGIICVFAINTGGLLIGAALAVSGILMIALAQITMVVIDTAQNTARIAETLDRAFPSGTQNRWAFKEDVLVAENHIKHRVAEGSGRWTEAP